MPAFASDRCGILCAVHHGFRSMQVQGYGYGPLVSSTAQGRYSDGMCRLLGYSISAARLSLRQVLGPAATSDFRRLSEIHRDGWGVALGGCQGGLDSVGQPGDQRLYHTTMAAYSDPEFNTLADVPAEVALWHLRWGSPGIPGIMENVQPFTYDDMTFIHNGHIASSTGVNILDDPTFEVDRRTVVAISPHSDSAVVFAVIAGFVSAGLPLDEAVRRAVAKLRRSYPNASYNCIVCDSDRFVALHATSGAPTLGEIVNSYADYGWGGQADDYGDMWYRATGPVESGHRWDTGSPASDTFETADDFTAPFGRTQNATDNAHGMGTAGGVEVGGCAVGAEGAVEGDAAVEGARGVVVASSGFQHPQSEGWKALPNNHMIVSALATGDFRIRGL
ncbi:Glutamine amidotransferase domain-containing protein [Bifidobacterium bohemicum]|nr:Glutamine amidotransferase domain-containing protein [Bifidobacterium bohemicum]